MSCVISFCYEVRLQNEKRIPRGPRPVMDVHGPGVVGKIPPVIAENADLHDHHRDDHPLVETLVFFHAVYEEGDVSGRSIQQKGSQAAPFCSFRWR